VTTPGGETRLHHVGFVVSSIERTVDGMSRSLGLRWHGEVFADPIQRVKVTFLGEDGTPQVELVEPGAEQSPVGAFLTRGGGLHHLCYEVGDLDGQLRDARGSGAIVVRQPAPAVAFGGRRIAWVYTREKLLIEYLERERLTE